MLNKTRFSGAGLAALAALVYGPTAEAQRVSADIHIGAGPIGGVIRVRDDAPVYRPRHVVVERGPRVIVVDRRRGWHPGKVRHAKAIVVYYDPRSRRYFDSYRRGYDRVHVYYDGRRYVRYDDDRNDWRDWDRRNGYDRYDRYDGWDGRRDDRRDHRDDRWDDRRDRRDDRHDGRRDRRDHRRGN